MITMPSLWIGTLPHRGLSASDEVVEEL